MSHTENLSKVSNPVFPVLAGIAFFGAALLITPLSAAGTAKAHKAHKARHSVHNVEPPQDNVSESSVAQESPASSATESASASEAPAPDPLVGRTKFDWQTQTAASGEDADAALAREKQAKDKQRMTTHVGDAKLIAFQDFYPFPEPAPAAKTPESKSNKSLYWIGATGVALVAGVAAYFIFSGEDEPERVQTVLAFE